MMKIPQRAHLCSHKLEPFNAGSEYISYIEIDDEEVTRQDLCTTCAEKLQKKGIHWKGKIPVKKEREITPDLRVLQLFKECDDLAVRYVIALYLERRKQLIKRQEIKEKIIFELPSSGEVFILEKVAFTPTLAQKVTALLDG